MGFLKRRNSGVATGLMAGLGVGGVIALVVGVFVVPTIVIGGIAGSLLGYGFAKGAGAAIVFSIASSAVIGIIRAATGSPVVPASG